MKNLLRATLFALVCVCVPNLQAQTSTFTYQGNLSDGVTAANGTYQMQFALFDAESGGTQQGSTMTNNSVSIVNGVFTVPLDFTGAPFTAGADRWLEISVKKPAEPGFTTLSPRQQLTASAYSVRTLSAGAADSLSADCVLCVNDGQIATVSGAKVAGSVANAANASSATVANNVSGVLAVNHGGTGTSSKNFADLSTTQSIGGNKSFSGNFSVGGSFAALLGQSASTVTGTAPLTAATAGSFTLIPGLTQTINVPANSLAYVISDGGLVTTSTGATGFSSVDITVTVDGAIVANGGYHRVIAANTTGVTQISANWAMSLATPVTAGSHTFAVSAALNSGTAATVSGNSSSPMQGRLVVILVKN